MAHTIINSRDFVKAWMTLPGVEDVARKLKITKQQASAKATTLRKRGVKLPVKKTSTRSTNDSVEELNKIVLKYSEQPSFVEKARSAKKRTQPFYL